MPALNKFNCFVEDLAEKKHDLQNDALKWVLTNTAPSASNAVKADIVGALAAGNGYAAAGIPATITTSAQTGGIYKLVLADPTFTASGGQVGPGRYAVLVNTTPAAGLLIGWVDRGSSFTLEDGDRVDIDLDQSGGTLTIQ